MGQEVEVALHEAIANAIKHRCKNEPAKNVQCCLAVEQDGELLVVVRDHERRWARERVLSGCRYRPSSVIGSASHRMPTRHVALVKPGERPLLHLSRSTQNQTFAGRSVVGAGQPTRLALTPILPGRARSSSAKAAAERRQCLTIL